MLIEFKYIFYLSQVVGYTVNICLSAEINTCEALHFQQIPCL